MPRDKTEAHKRIIKAATSEFLEYGFEGASMRRIAENSGITAGALYKHFKNKEDMFSALVEPTINELMAKYQEFCEQGYEVMKCGDVQQLWNESESETKWLPSANTSSAETRSMGRRIAAALGMTERTYRKTLSALRRYTDILENRLRERDYTFRYEAQPSCAMFKYREAFVRNDGERYSDFLNKVHHNGEAKLHADRLFPYDIVRAAMGNVSAAETVSLDAAWKSMPDLTASKRENALAVIDGSGSMTCDCGSIRPIDAALSLGIYFAEHNTGAFANHFITFSETPRLVEIKGRNIVEKVHYCRTFNEVANTNLEAVFMLILCTAMKNVVPAADMPSKLYIISDMQFDCCIVGGNDEPMFREMRRLYARYGYRLPDIVFWNVNARFDAVPVNRSETGAALVSGYSPAVFDMVGGR